MSICEKHGISRSVSWISCYVYDNFGVKGGERHGYEKTGEFLKALRKEKGLTQEQLAEVFLISGRTVSRWETGRNMPDLSILIQLAEFYDVDVKEILDGERKGENMDKEMKETLSKVADYNKLEKQEAARAGNTAFGLTFAVCAAAIILQLIITARLDIVAGETAVLLTGGIVYLGMIVYNGVYETGTGFKNSIFTDALISVICAAFFTGILAFCYMRMGAEASQTARVSLVFFAGITAAGFAVLRILAYSARRIKEQLGETSDAAGQEMSVKKNPSEKERQTKHQPAQEPQLVSIFTADGNMQAEMIISTLKENGITAYGQDLGDAGFAAVRYGMGRGINDRIAIITSDIQAERAMQILAEMGLE